MKFSIEFFWFLCIGHVFAFVLCENSTPGSDVSVDNAIDNSTVDYEYDDESDNRIETETNGNESVSSAITQLHMETATISNERKIDELSNALKQIIFNIRQKFKKIDIVFLLDASSSVGKLNFISELKFVTKFLSDFNVSFNYTRVALVSFSSPGKIVSQKYTNSKN